MSEIKKHRARQLALNHKKRKLAALHLNGSKSTLDLEKEEAEPEGKDNALNYDTNIRACLAAFYIGTGGYDIGSVASFLGVPGGRSFERTFHRHSRTLHSTIMGICKDVMKDAFYDEVAATIRDKFGEKYSNEEIEKYTDDMKNETYDGIPHELQRIGISVSYDMGWNKRSTGRVYDSLSGHGFIIGCMTGKVIGFGVSKKKCSVCRHVNKHNYEQTQAHLAVCNINSTGSSGAMESQVALDLTIKVFEESNGHVYVAEIVPVPPY